VRAFPGLAPGTDKDYLALPTRVTIPAQSDRSSALSVVTFADNVDEFDEIVKAKIVADAAYAVDPNHSAAMVTILDQTPTPVISIGSPSIQEGDSGNQSVNFPIVVQPASQKGISVDAQTSTVALINGQLVQGTATSGTTCGSGDFLARSSRLQIPNFTTSFSATVPVCGDLRRESNETFFLALSDPSFAALSSQASSGFLFGKCTIVDNDGSTGSFLLEPFESTAAVGDRANYAFTWTVPDPMSWHALQSLGLRFRDGDDVAISLVWDETSNTFSLFDEATGPRGRALAPGSHSRLETNEATLFLEDSSVVGSGPTGPSVRLNLALAFKSRAAGHTFDVEVLGRDDLGGLDEFRHAGNLSVTRNPFDSGDGEPSN
jgi:hypothetical protein